MSTTAKRDAIEEVLRQHRLRDLWQLTRVAEFRNEADIGAERDALDALIEYNGWGQEKWTVIEFDVNHLSTDGGIVFRIGMPVFGRERHSIKLTRFIPRLKPWTFSLPLCKGRQRD